MKTITRSLFLATVLAIGWCQSDAHGGRTANFHDSPPPRHVTSVAGTSVQQAKWTVMLYMNGDNDLNDFAIRDFQEMAKVKDNALVNVVIQLDRIGGLDTDDSWGETRRFLMKKNLKPIRSQALAGFHEESNMGDLATLRSFVTWAKENFPADRYMLILWSHGDGWRRFITDPLFEPSQRNREVFMAEELLKKGELADSTLASLNLMRTSLEPQYRTLSEDQTNGHDKLYVREIQDALEGVFNATSKLALIGFDACLMQMIETAYAMRNVADLMVGSEELVPGEGWRYERWLEKLVTNPNMDGSAVAKLIVNSYEATYETIRPDTTFSAIKVGNNEIGKLATAVSVFARELTISLATELPQITKARLSCFVFAPGRAYHGIDLLRFSTQIAAANVRPQLKASAAEIITLIDSMVLDNYAGSQRGGEFGSHGLAIYFPANNEAYQSDKYKQAYTDENEYQVIQFVREHTWDNFLHAYFKLT